MKYFITILIFFSLISSAYTKNYNLNDTIENKIQLTNKIYLDVSPGKWKVIEKYIWFWGAINITNYSFAKINQNKISRVIEVQIAKMSGGYQADVDFFIHEYFFKNKHDGCYQRPEYTLVQRYKLGNTTNCLIVRHIDTNKELYSPDDPETYVERANYRNYVEQNNLKFPKIMLSSQHAYFSRLVSNNMITVAYFDEPDLDANSTVLEFFSEDSSEFHPLKIDRFPKHKELMQKYLNKSFIRHKEFEKSVKVKKKHQLNFNDIELDESNLLENLNKLNELFKSGALTEEEFKKAKKRILNK